MAGLHLIKTYYSDTDEDENESNEEKKKEDTADVVDRLYCWFNYLHSWICYFLNLEYTFLINDRLALPESILSWQGVPHHEETIDDPLNHDGRVRSFKHERGNWPTLVYINCKCVISKLIFGINLYTLRYEQYLFKYS